MYSNDPILSLPELHENAPLSVHPFEGAQFRKPPLKHTSAKNAQVHLGICSSSRSARQEHPCKRVSVKGVQDGHRARSSLFFAQQNEEKNEPADEFSPRSHISLGMQIQRPNEKYEHGLPAQQILTEERKETADKRGDDSLPHPQASLEMQIPQTNEEYENGLSVSYDHKLQSLCKRGHLDKALHLLAESASIPSLSSYLSLLQACIRSRSLAYVRQVYAHISSYKLALKGILGDYLAMALARCGDIEDARQVASSLPHLTVFSWTAIISAHAEQGLGQEAFELYHQMLDQGVRPDRYTFVSLFRACSSMSNLAWGRELHAEACMKGFTFDLFINNSLMTMYGKHGTVLDAENLFEAVPSRDIVSWNAMLSVYVENDNHKEKALRLYRQMQEEGLDSNQQTFVIALQACVLLAEEEEACLKDGRPIKVKALSIGEALHADARAKGFTLDLYVGTALSTMYGKCGAIVQAENLFGTLPQRSLISWNSMLSACVAQRQGIKALQMYRLLHEEGVIPDELTVVFALQACGSLGENEDAFEEVIRQVSLQIGQALHIDVCSADLESDVFVGTALLTMYSKCGYILAAEEVFCDFSELSMVLWSAMLAAYIEQGLGRKALVLFRQMQEEYICPCAQMLVLAIQACGILVDDEEFPTEGECSNKLVALEIGHALHVFACKSGLALDVLVSTALVTMYGKCGSIIEVDCVFRAIVNPDVVTYTAVLSAYITQGCSEQAIALYKEMPKQHLILDDVTLICLLQACGEIGSLELCNDLHFTIIAASYDMIASVTLALVHAYGCCASMSDGQVVFDGLCKPDTSLWTACIMGHAGEGNLEGSLYMLDQLILAGLIPGESAMSSALLACGHTGNIVKAFEIFNSMSNGIAPQLKHYGIMVELLGRAGDFQKIDDLLSRMPLEADVSIWMCLLGALCAHNYTELARDAYNRALSLQPNQASAYILMSNAYADLVC